MEYQFEEWFGDLIDNKVQAHYDLPRQGAEPWHGSPTVWDSMISGKALFIGGYAQLEVYDMSAVSVIGSGKLTGCQREPQLITQQLSTLTVAVRCKMADRLRPFVFCFSVLLSIFREVLLKVSDDFFLSTAQNPWHSLPFDSLPLVIGASPIERAFINFGFTSIYLES